MAKIETTEVMDPNGVMKQVKTLNLNRGEAIALGGVAIVGGGYAVYRGVKGLAGIVKRGWNARKKEKEGVKAETTAKVDGQQVQAEVVNEKKEENKQ